MPGDSVRHAANAMRLGDPVVVTDGADRENEGDLIVATDHLTTGWIAFMMDRCHGLIYLPKTAERAAALRPATGRVAAGQQAQRRLAGIDESVLSLSAWEVAAHFAEHVLDC